MSGSYTRQRRATRPQLEGLELRLVLSETAPPVLFEAYTRVTERGGIGLGFDIQDVQWPGANQRYLSDSVSHSDTISLIQDVWPADISGLAAAAVEGSNGFLSLSNEVLFHYEGTPQWIIMGSTMSAMSDTRIYVKGPPGTPYRLRLDTTYEVPQNGGNWFGADGWVSDLEVHGQSVSTITKEHPQYPGVVYSLVPYPGSILNPHYALGERLFSTHWVSTPRSESFTSHIRSRWDLDVTNLAMDADIIMGEADLATTRDLVKFDYTISNRPGPFTVGLYRSSDDEFDPDSDVFLASQIVTPRPSNPQEQGSFTLGSPLQYDPERPYLLVVADPWSVAAPQGAIQETEDRSNNMARIRDPGPDIAVTRLEMGRTAAEWLVYYTVANYLGSFDLGLYQAEAEPFMPEEDVLLAKQRVTPHPTDPQAPAVFTLSIPVVYSPDTPTLLAVADPPSAEGGSGSITESNESNNVSSYELNIFDIVITSANLTGPGVADDYPQGIASVAFGYEIYGHTRPFIVNVYRSSDHMYNAQLDGAAIGSIVVSPDALHPSGRTVINLQQTLSPLAFDPALPYLLVVADPWSNSNPYGDIRESIDEINNSQSVSVYVANAHPIIVKVTRITSVDRPDGLSFRYDLNSTTGQDSHLAYVQMHEYINYDRTFFPLPWLPIIPHGWLDGRRSMNIQFDADGEAYFLDVHEPWRSYLIDPSKWLARFKENFRVTVSVDQQYLFSAPWTNHRTANVPNGGLFRISKTILSRRQGRKLSWYQRIEKHGEVYDSLQYSHSL